MQSDWKEIYRLTAERTGKDEQLYKEMGNFVFADLNAKMRRPKNLIIKLKGVGTWFLRKMRLQAVVDLFPPDFSKTIDDFESPMGFLKHENKKEIYDIFTERLKDYEEYLELKHKIRLLRNETGVLLQPNKGED